MNITTESSLSLLNLLSQDLSNIFLTVVSVGGCGEGLNPIVMSVTLIYFILKMVDSKIIATKIEKI